MTAPAAAPARPAPTAEQFEGWIASLAALAADADAVGYEFVEADPALEHVRAMIAAAARCLDTAAEILASRVPTADLARCDHAARALARRPKR